MFLQDGLNACNRGVLLPYGDVDADEVFALLVDDRVKSNGCLAGLAVADDQLALAAPNGNHTIDGLQTCLYRRVDRLAFNHAGSDALDVSALVGHNRTSIVEWLTEGAHDTPNQCIPDGYFDDTPGSTYLVVLFDVCILAQDGATDRFFLKVKGHAHQPGARKFYQLKILYILQAVDASDAVLHRDHRTN